MKKNYQKPAMRVVRIQQSSMICSTTVGFVGGNANLNYSGGGSDEARSRTVSWDDEE